MQVLRELDLISLVNDAFSIVQVCSTKWVGDYNELGRQSEEAAVAYFKAVYLQMVRGKPRKKFIRIASLRTENVTRKLKSANLLWRGYNGPGRGHRDGARPRQ
jgi:hypothetical protein